MTTLGLPVVFGVLVALLAFLVSLVLGTNHGGGGGPSPAPPAETPQSTEVTAFLDSLGVNIHTTYNDTPYGNGAEVVRLVSDLGVDHVRDALVVSRAADQVPVFTALRDRGVSSLLLVGDPKADPPTGSVEAKIAALAGPLRGSVDAVEGANEWDCSGRPSWPSELVADQQQWQRALQADPATQSLTLVGPSFCRGDSPAVFGNHTDLMDVGSFHPYAGGGLPEPIIQDRMSTAARVSGSDPLWATETGYHNAVNGQNSQRAVTEEQAAAYVLRTYLANFGAGVPRTYLYELFDEFVDPGRVEQEANFGLVRRDGTPKPAYRALQALVRTMEGAERSQPGRGPAQPPAMDLSGGSATTRHLTLDAGGGTRVVVLWDGGPVSPDGTSRSTDVTMSFSGPVEAARSVPSTAQTSSVTGVRTTIPVSGSPTVVVVTPAG